MRKTLIALATLLPLIPGRAHAPDDPKFEAEATAGLKALAPDAVPLWEAANTKRAGDAAAQAEAAAGYRQVIELAPGFAHAHRRLCHLLRAEGRRSEALAECEKAHQLAETPENQAALAAVLAMEGASPAEVERAHQLAQAAAAA